MNVCPWGSEPNDCAVMVSPLAKLNVQFAIGHFNRKGPGRIFVLNTTYKVLLLTMASAKNGNPSLLMGQKACLDLRKPPAQWPSVFKLIWPGAVNEFTVVRVKIMNTRTHATNPATNPRFRIVIMIHWNDRTPPCCVLATC